MDDSQDVPTIARREFSLTLLGALSLAAFEAVADLRDTSLRADIHPW